MGLEDVLPFITMSLLLWRFLVLIRIDKLDPEKKSISGKLIFGVYAFDLMLPILKDSKSKKKTELIRKANFLLILFYISAISFFVFIYIKYG